MSSKQETLDFLNEAAHYLHDVWYSDLVDGGCAVVSDLLVDVARRLGAFNAKVVYGWAQPSGVPDWGDKKETWEVTEHVWIDVDGTRFDPTWSPQDIEGSGYTEDETVRSGWHLLRGKKREFHVRDILEQVCGIPASKP